MWTQIRGFSNKVDRTIVRKEFLVVYGHANIHLESNHPVFDDPLSSAPSFFIFKVHKNHPLRVSSAGYNHVYFYPLKPDKRMPSDVYEDKTAYDLATFALFPYEVPQEKINPNTWQNVASFSDGFTSVDFNQSPASLLYLPHKIGLHPEWVYCWGQTSPSQVTAHLFHWLRSVHEIYSSNEKTHKQKLEGRVSLGNERARNLLFEKLIPMLEKKFKSKLSFPKFPA